MNTIEIEKRAFLSDDEYLELKKTLPKLGALINHSKQITYYLDHAVDTRIQISTTGGKLWQKLGKIHDDSRQEYELNLSNDDAICALKIFENMGFPPKIKWFRERYLYAVNDLEVALDSTVGYGKILEVEMRCSDAKLDYAETKIGSLLESLGITPQSRQDFDMAYKIYIETWISATNHLTDDWIVK